jgi:tetratricopeptide (TPR) repeat protein
LILGCVGGLAFAALRFTEWSISAVMEKGGDAKAEGGPQAKKVAAAEREAVKRKLEFPKGAVTADVQRELVLTWLRKIYETEEVGEAHGNLIPADKWSALKQATIAKATGAPGTPSSRLLQGLGLELLPVADRDPVVAYGVACALGEHEAATVLLEKAWAGLSDQPGRETLAFLVAAERCALVPGSGDEEDDEVAAVRKSLLAQAVKALSKALEAEGGFAEWPDPVVAWVLSSGSRDSLMDQAHLEVMEVVTENAKMKPWVKHWIAGLHHINAAWAARGSGYAHTVTQSGHRIFESELKKALVELEAACRENPRSAEPASNLITLAMADSERPVAEMREALERAAAVEVDHQPSYAKMMYGLWPRWHGSHSKMVQFGEVCLASGRFDSGVPWWLVNAHRSIASEWDLPDYYFLELKEFGPLKELFEGYEKEPRREAWRTHDRTLAAVVSFKCGKYDEAAKWLAKLEGRLDEAVLEKWDDLDSEFLVGKTAAFAGSKGPELRKAETAEQKFAAGKALALYDEVLKAEASLPPVGRGYLEHRRAAMALESDLAERKPFPLAPVTGFAGWTRQGGGWRMLPEGGLEHGGRALYSATTHLGRVGPKFELTGEVEFLNTEGRAEAWISFGYPEKLKGGRWTAMRFSFEAGRARALLSRGLGETAQRAPLGTTPKLAFVLRSAPKGIALEVNGQVVWTGEPTPGGFVEERHSQIGVGALTTAPATRVKFTGLTLRRL